MCRNLLSCILENNLVNRLIKTPADDLNARIAHRVSALRAERELTLEALAVRCDVSRSMISLIERGESSPTAVVLEKLRPVWV